MTARELLETFHTTVSKLYVAMGKCKGETMLPLPPLDVLVRAPFGWERRGLPPVPQAFGRGSWRAAATEFRRRLAVTAPDAPIHSQLFVFRPFIALSFPASPPQSTDKGRQDKDRVHVLETAVVTWTLQIKDVLKKDPEHVFIEHANPGPMAGLDFWAQKAFDLQSIQKQLSSDKISKVMKVLELTKSPYFIAFKALCKEVDAAYAEATDNVNYLKPLQPYFEQLSTPEDFKELPDLFQPIMHILLMVWEHSKYYNSHICLAVLTRQICNDVIEQARNYVGAEELFAIEPQEAVARLLLALDVCGDLKRCYFQYKALAAKKAPKTQPWDIQSSALFQRLDAFMERCFDLKELCRTVTQFQKLEVVVMGGDKGQTLTSSLEFVHRDFSSILAKFAEGGYDVLDVNESRFEDDISAFNGKIKELERRLALVINHGFEDCGTVQTAFKMIDSFAELLERDFVQADLESKHLELIKQYSEGACPTFSTPIEGVALAAVPCSLASHGTARRTAARSPPPPPPPRAPARASRIAAPHDVQSSRKCRRFSPRTRASRARASFLSATGRRFTSTCRLCRVRSRGCKG